MFGILLKILIALFMGITGYVFWQYKKSERRENGLVVLCSGVLIVLVAISFFVTPSASPVPDVPRGWDSAKAEILAQQVSKLVPGGGRVLVFMASETAVRQQDAMRAQRENYLYGLKRGLAPGLTLVLAETRSTTAPGVDSFHQDLLDAALRANPDVKAVVNFFWMPGPVRLSGGSRPKMVVSGLTEELARKEIAAGFVDAAVVDKTNSGVNLWEEPSGSVQDIFDRRYILVTATTAKPASNP